MERIGDLVLIGADWSKLKNESVSSDGVKCNTELTQELSLNCAMFAVAVDWLMLKRFTDANRCYIQLLITIYYRSRSLRRTLFSLQLCSVFSLPFSHQIQNRSSMWWLTKCQLIFNSNRMILSCTKGNLFDLRNKWKKAPRTRRKLFYSSIAITISQNVCHSRRKVYWLTFIDRGKLLSKSMRCEQTVN